MNWIFEAYSNVYKVAMMRDKEHTIFVAPRKGTDGRRRGRLSRRG
jgi:hypothetical protein